MFDYFKEYQFNFIELGKRKNNLKINSLDKNEYPFALYIFNLSKLNKKSFILCFQKIHVHILQTFLPF